MVFPIKVSTCLCWNLDKQNTKILLSSMWNSIKFLYCKLAVKRMPWVTEELFYGLVICLFVLWFSLFVIFFNSCVVLFVWFGVCLLMLFDFGFWLLLMLLSFFFHFNNQCICTVLTSVWKLMLFKIIITYNKNNLWTKKECSL